MLEIIFLIIISGYLIISVAMVIGAKKTFPQLPDNLLPAVSIVVAARNEEKNILSCLESLDNLIYPDHKLEIIVIDDASSDRTLKIT